MDLDFLPRHLVVVGGSYIGLEFAQMFRRFGSEVTVIEKGSRLISPRGRGRLRGHPGDPGRGRHRLPPRRRMHPLRPQRQGHRSASTAPPASRAVGRLACAAGGGPHAEHRRSRPRQGRRRRPTSAATSPSTTSCAPRAGHLGAGRLQRQRRLHPHRLQRFRDRRGQSARQRPRRSATASPAYALYIDPPLGRVGMTEAEARKSGRQRAGRPAADDPRRPRRRKGRDARLHEDRWSMPTPGKSSAPRSSAPAATRWCTAYST